MEDDFSPETDVGKMFAMFSARQTTTKVAFSAYFNRDLWQLGPEHVIRYHGLLLNDGNAYNPFTGVFTVPVTGTYLFTATAEDAKHDLIWLRIVKDNVLQSSIKIYPYQIGSMLYNSQGSNTVIIRCTQGESVWVGVDGNENGESLEGSSTLRTNTFSGVLLYI